MTAIRVMSAICVVISNMDSCRCEPIVGLMGKTSGFATLGDCASTHDCLIFSFLQLSDLITCKPFAFFHVTLAIGANRNTSVLKSTLVIW